jgi:anaerobic selenocysteine-containing dehydrogenase
LRRDPSAYDGQFANNGWLQELPKPMSKLTWDNAVMIGPKMAEREGIKSMDVVTLELDGRKVTGASLDSGWSSGSFCHRASRLRAPQSGTRRDGRGI